MKKLNKNQRREKMMEMLENKFGIKSVYSTEDFDGTREDENYGIWIVADNEEKIYGNKIFDYYNKSNKYYFGVLKTFRNKIEKQGWYFSWNDCATMMIYEV
jgi:hypothetical protein